MGKKGGRWSGERATVRRKADNIRHRNKRERKIVERRFEAPAFFFDAYNSIYCSHFQLIAAIAITAIAVVTAPVFFLYSRSLHVIIHFRDKRNVCHNSNFYLHKLLIRTVKTVHRARDAWFVCVLVCLDFVCVCVCKNTPQYFNLVRASHMMKFSICCLEYGPCCRCQLMTKFLWDGGGNIDSGNDFDGGSSSISIRISFAIGHQYRF